jgi:Fe2+/Zn2+ uptake regulation proteins
MAENPVLVPFKKPKHDHERCIDHALKEAESVCGKRGQRLTKLRRRVLELVWCRHEPAKAYDILDELRQDYRRAAPPTVYRALDFLLNEGLIHRINSLNAFVGCGNPKMSHSGQFMICRQCHTVAEINDPEITRMLARKAKRIGFRAARQSIEIEGLCPGCGAA